MNKKSMSNEQRFNQRGIALAVTLMVLLILVVVAVSIGSIGVFNLRHISNYRDSIKAYYAARAGVTDAIEQLRATPTATPTPTPSPTVTLTNNATYTFNFVGSGKYDSTTNISGTSGTITRTIDNIAVPEGYAYIIGTGVCNNQIRRVAAMMYGGVTSSNPPWNYALFGDLSLSVGGTADITGDVGTNASSLTIGGSSTVSGDQDVNAGKTMPAVTDPLASATLSGGVISTTQTLTPGKYTSVAIPSGRSYTVTLSAGTYSFSSFDLANKGKIAISSGPVYIYVSGNIWLTGGDCVVNTGHNAADCLFYGTTSCTSVGMRGGSDAYYGVYAPSATVSFAGTSDMHGSAIGKYADATGTANIIYDTNLESLAGSSSATYLDAITWQNVY